MSGTVKKIPVKAGQVRGKSQSCYAMSSGINCMPRERKVMARHK